MMTPPIEEAFRKVDEVLSKYPPPRKEACGCDACAGDSALIASGSQKVPQDVTHEEVRAAFWSAYTTWDVDWPELAHFARAALRFLQTDSSFSLLLSLDLEMVYNKLLVSAYPALELEFAPAEPMPAEDRQAIFAAVGSRLTHQEFEDSEDVDDIAHALCFLAGFHTPIQPLLKQWEHSDVPLVQVRLCYFLADWWMAPHPNRLQSLTFLDRVPTLAGNQEALDAFLAEGHIARYLRGHQDVLDVMSEEARYTVEWAMKHANPHA